jgi:hypothetical protein
MRLLFILATLTVLCSHVALCDTVVISTYDPSRNQWESGNLILKPNNGQLILVSFELRHKKISKFVIRIGPSKIDLTDTFFGTGTAFPTRSQVVVFHLADAGPNAGVEISLPFLTSDGSCQGKNFRVERGKLVKSYVSDVSSVRCEY